MTTLLAVFLSCLGAFSTVSAGSLRAAEPEKKEFRRTLGVGVAYTGGLIRYGFKKTWAAELHVLTGGNDSNDGNVSSLVVGARGYRHFRTDQRLQLFCGIEADSANAESSTLQASGFLAGGFGGLEYYVLPRLSLGIDLGPYYVNLKENGGTSDSGVDFILNTFLNFYIF